MRIVRVPFFVLLWKDNGTVRGSADAAPKVA